MSYIEVLKEAPLLQGLSADQLEAMLPTNAIITCQRHQVIFEENTIGREIYLVLEGEVAVELDPAREDTIEKGSTELRVIRTFGPGESFGGMAVLNRQPLAATLVATHDDTKLPVIQFSITYCKRRRSYKTLPATCRTNCGAAIRALLKRCWRAIS